MLNLIKHLHQHNIVEDVSKIFHYIANFMLLRTV